MNEFRKELKITMRSIPGIVTSIFVLSAVLMNILANKSIINHQYVSVTSGIVLSWISYLCMDCVCKHFGARAATILNAFAMIVSLLSSALIAVVLLIPGTWASSLGYTDISTQQIINNSLNSTLSSTWYVVIGSSLAMLLGGTTNSIINKLVGRLVSQKTYTGFMIRSSVSTAAGQLVDNLVFALFVSYFFFGWTMNQVIGCSIVGMLLELVIESIFSPIGYKVVKKWEKENVGSEYLTFIKSKETR